MTAAKHNASTRGRKGRRMFGAIRRLPSGRWQARYRDHQGQTHTAPTTFLTKADAARYLALVEADLTRHVFHDPKKGRSCSATGLGAGPRP